MDLIKPGDRIPAAAVNEGILARKQLKTIKVGSGLIMRNFQDGIYLDTAAQTVSLPLGQYQGQALYMVSQLQYGWTFGQIVSMS